jgi:hypothetical protein
MNKLWMEVLKMSEEKVLDGFGVVEKKEECVTKKGDKYWKFVIDGKTYSLFEYPAGEKVSVGDNVKIVWTESEKESQYGPVTYKNLKSIFKDTPEEVDVANGGEGVDTPTSTKIKEIKELIGTKDRRIVRQSCLGYANQLLATYYGQFNRRETSEGVTIISTMEDELIRIAEKLENWVYRKEGGENA